MEKVDVVKRLIRSHNYRDTERVYLRCHELGIHVNKTALYRFSEKLALIDKASRHAPVRKTTNASPASASVSSSPLYQQRLAEEDTLTQHGLDEFEPPSYAVNSEVQSPEPAPDISTARQNQSKKAESMSFAEAKRREAEITFELGALRIKEHALLEELNILAAIIDEKH